MKSGERAYTDLGGRGLALMMWSETVQRRMWGGSDGEYHDTRCRTRAGFTEKFTVEDEMHGPKFSTLPPRSMQELGRAVVF